MNRVKIKEEARAMIKGNIWNILKPYAVIIGISLVIGLISGSTMNNNEPNLVASIINLIAEIAMIPLSFGALVYLVKFVRKEPYELKDIFGYYSKFWPIFALNFLMGLFIGLWSLLFLIPGIIAAISYTMSMLIMVDGEEDAMECLRKSKAMMKGYKWDFVVFHLSFILWHLLGMVTLGIAYIYVWPYIMVSEVLYYEELKKVNPPKEK